MALINATPSNHTVDRLGRIWSGLSTADRHVLLGHDREVLSDADKIRLARVVSALGRRMREKNGTAPPGLRPGRQRTPRT